MSRTERLAWLRQYGSHTMAYSTLQPGLEYFDRPGLGFLAYLEFRHPWLARGGRRLVLSDPVGAPENTPALLAAFLQIGRPTVFLQASGRVAAQLRTLGLRVNPLGIETDLALEGFALEGKEKTLLRQWRNKALREGVEVQECPLDELPGPEVVALSNDWLAGRPAKRELRLLTRPLVKEREEGVRYFWARHRGRLVGMILFDPVYEAEAVVGYYWNLVRTARDAPRGTSDLITLTALEVFRREGIRTLHFGLSPLSGLTRTAPEGSNRLTHAVLRLLHDYGDRLYGFAKNTFHKRAYRGTVRQVYCAGTEGISLREVLAVMKALAVI